jgi:AraC-like DNA-binding protein
MSRPHVHAEVEFNLVLSGLARYETSEGSFEVPVRRLLVFWGGYPHRLVVEGHVDLLCVTVPLGSLSGGRPAQRAVRTVLSGRRLLGAADEGLHDAFLLHRWARELSRGVPDARADACLLEMHARLARLACTAGGEPPQGQVRRGDPGAAERLLTCLARMYREHLRVEDVAREAGVHPTYAALAFKQAFGVTLWEYVTQLRLAHAQRLLSGTDWGVDRIAFESGFQTRSSFYRAFRAGVGTTPLRFRRDAAHSPSRPHPGHPRPAGTAVVGADQG